MDRQEIVKLFLSHGFQLSENTLSIAEENPEATLSFIEKLNPRPFIVTKNHLKGMHEEKKEEKKITVNLLKEFAVKKKELRPEDYSKCFANFYENIKEMLIKNTKLTGLVSINKITQNTMDFSLIALVRDKGQKNLLVEDMTGEIHVFFEKESEKFFDLTEIDDVLGLVCTRDGENIYVKDVFYPNISITREINRTTKEMKIFYIYKPSLLCEEEFNKLSDILKQTKKIDPIFVFGEWEDKGVMKEFDNIFLLGNTTPPKMFQIENVLILTLPKADSMENILKKRLIRNNGLMNIFTVEEIPDIILSSESGTHCKNYKGTTIVSNADKNKYFILDLKTRECEEGKI